MSKRTGNKDTRAAKYRSQRHAARMAHRKRKSAAYRITMTKTVGGMFVRFAAHQRAAEAALGLHALITVGYVPRLGADHPLMIEFSAIAGRVVGLLKQLENKRARRYPGQEYEVEALEADVAELQPPLAAVAEKMRAWADKNPQGVFGDPIQIPGAPPTTGAGLTTAAVLQERVDIENNRRVRAGLPPIKS